LTDRTREEEGRNGEREEGRGGEGGGMRLVLFDVPGAEPLPFALEHKLHEGPRVCHGRLGREGRREGGRVSGREGVSFRLRETEIMRGRKGQKHKGRRRGCVVREGAVDVCVVREGDIIHIPPESPERLDCPSQQRPVFPFLLQPSRDPSPSLPPPQWVAPEWLCQRPWGMLHVCRRRNEEREG